MDNLLNKVMLPLAEAKDIEAMRSFALSMSIVFPIVFMLLLPWLFNRSYPIWPLAIPLILMTFYVVYPKAIYYPYYCWMIIASLIGWLNTKLILGLVFFLVITPIGVTMKLLGKLQYKKQVKENSNWCRTPHTDARKEKKRLEEPF